MANSLSHFKILYNFLNNNILTNITFIFIIFVLSSLVDDYGINAINDTNVYDLQNSSSEKLKQNNDSMIINYSNSNITNLTNNNEDSIYGQIATFENNVYVVWQESVTESLPEHNYDIFFVRSEDKGKTFEMPINLSNNIEFSERPQIAASRNGIFIVWTDTIDTNKKKIIFTKSIDKGKTFTQSRNSKQ